MLKAYRYRIYPTPVQIAQIEQTFGVCRLVYNLGLAIKIHAWKQHQKNLSAYDLMKQLPDFKTGFPWVGEVDSQSLLQSLLNMESAYKKFFKGGGFPKFKSRRGRQSFSAPCNKREVDFENEFLTIPKLKGIPIVLSRRFKGDIKTVTISRVPSGKYYASILVDNLISLPEKSKTSREGAIGIDLGLKDFAVTSDGRKFGNPKYLKEALARLRCLDKRASRKKKGSSNQKKAYKKLAIQHERVANKRRDFLQKLSTKIVSESQVTTICVEDLAVKNMMANRKLARAIADVGWGEFLRMLRYKCEWAGKNFLVIGRFEPSSKTCSCCEAINENLTLADREWTCEVCKTVHDRDINAAINICNFAIKNSGRGTSEEPVELLTQVGARYKRKQENRKITPNKGE